MKSGFGGIPFGQNAVSHLFPLGTQDAHGVSGMASQYQLAVVRETTFFSVSEHLCICSPSCSNHTLNHSNSPFHSLQPSNQPSIPPRLFNPSNSTFSIPPTNPQPLNLSNQPQPLNPQPSTPQPLNP